MKLIRLPLTVSFLVILLISAEKAGAANTLVYFQDHPRFEFDIKLLKLALERTEDEFGETSLVPLRQPVNEARGLRLLESGKVDIAFVPTNRERELRFRSVHFPILAGLLGYRVLLIHSDRKGAFARLTTLDDLRSNMIGGFGMHWADMQILYANQLPVIGHPDYTELFNMLQQKRFDYFPRGLNEVWVELEEKKHSHADIMLEKNLALYYPFPRYYFVNKRDEELAKRLDQGLKSLKSDGTYDSLFLQTFGELLDSADIDSRTVFTLQNPFLAESTPLPDTSLWQSQD
jgi:ABC-type amino acid transport substrate-binding protein